MINKKAFSPYIRTAMYSTIVSPFVIKERAIYDYEVIYVMDGKCKITIGGKSFVAEKNDVIFIRPGVHHRMESFDESYFVQPHIHFDIIYSKKSDETPISFKAKYEMNEYERSLISEDVISDIEIPFIFVPADPEKFKKLFFEVIDIYTAKEPGYELVYKSAMLLLLECILSQFEPSTAGVDDTVSNSVTSVKNFIDANFTFDLSLNLLALQFHLNKYTMMRNFKRMYGENIMAYYRRKRLSFACGLLVNTDLSMTSVAQKLNFSDIYSFSRFFKTYVGTSPSDYRKNNAFSKAH